MLQLAVTLEISKGFFARVQQRPANEVHGIPDAVIEYDVSFHLQVNGIFEVRQKGCYSGSSSDQNQAPVVFGKGKAPIRQFDIDLVTFPDLVEHLSGEPPFD